MGRRPRSTGASTHPGVYFRQLNGRSVTWVTPTFFFGPVVAWHSAWKEAIVSRDFVGALLQLNAEKQVSREQLIGAVEDGDPVRLPARGRR